MIITRGYSQLMCLMMSHPSTGKVGLGREFDWQTIHTVCIFRNRISYQASLYWGGETWCIINLQLKLPVHPSVHVCTPTLDASLMQLVFTQIDLSDYCLMQPACSNLTSILQMEDESSAVQQLTNLRITVPPLSSSGEGVKDSTTEGGVVPVSPPDDPQEEGRSMGVVFVTSL